MTSASFSSWRNIGFEKREGGWRGAGPVTQLAIYLILPLGALDGGTLPASAIKRGVTSLFGPNRRSLSYQETRQVTTN